MTFTRDLTPPVRSVDRLASTTQPSPLVERLSAAAYTIPTDEPESDGTLAWERTTIVIVHVKAGGVEGLGYTYGDATAARLVAETLAPKAIGRPAFDIPATHASLVSAVRNVGRHGIAATAISAVDTALWDLKARLLDTSLVDLLGPVRDAIPAYGSGGFCTYSDARLDSQLRGWSDAGFRFVKMKVGRDPHADDHRIQVALGAIGREVQLFVDANGAYDRAAARAAAAAFGERGVRWLEEPVSSDDLDGLRELRRQVPPGMAVAAGEYGWDAHGFRRLLEADAVDVLQADATRCLGVTGFQVVAALCEAHGVPLSTHCAPALHAHLACSAQRAIHAEWFHDHVRIEEMLFDGTLRARDGMLVPDRSRPGLGLALKRADAARYLVWQSA